MILHGIEYQRPTSLNMRILADHVTYSFLAFLKSNFLVRAFQFGMKGVLSRIPDTSPEFCWIPIFVFFLHFYVFLNWPTPSVGGRSCDLLIFTRGPFWPPGIVIACVCLCVCLCVCMCVCQQFACPRDNSRPVRARIFMLGSTDVECLA